MACCDKKKPIFVGAMILVAITLVTSSTKNSASRPSQIPSQIPVSPNQLNGIGTLEQSDQEARLWVKALIHEPQDHTFKIGQQATVTFRCTGQKHYAGIVRKISPLNQYIPDEKVLYITLDQLPSTASIGEQAEILIALP